ncbi:MAG TPA: glycosyltransferase family 4 protein [Leptolyngbyaceae cyanobacterium M33_DOE_097]|nr:glycosyltransferase family 4 protein [Leptolyngbyaceae cyanobacterium M33_DOE_097]
MKVLHFNQSDTAGGAAIAGFRLHQGLLAQNIDSRLLVRKAKTNSERVATVAANSRLDRMLGRINNRFGLKYLNHVSSFDFVNHEWFRNADVLNFHNLHNGYFNYLAIAKLTQKKPAVFTLHDMWSFTGHCAYSYDCDRWKIGCGHCPHLDTYPAVQVDNTQLEWKLKNWVYSRSNLTIVTPSRWLYEQAQKSMLNRHPIHHIPYGIDTDTYQPLNFEYCRYVLGLPQQKHILMFAAESLLDARKGGDLLLEALKRLPDQLRSETTLLTIGTGGEAIAESTGIETFNLGYVSDDRLKVIAYSAADLFIFPTRADNLPLVLQESMACGTPMVSFKVGGVSDLVRPQITGYLATPEDPDDFSHGITELFQGCDLRNQMKKNCRAIALQEYSLDLQAKRYIELYLQAVQN